MRTFDGRETRQRRIARLLLIAGLAAAGSAEAAHLTVQLDGVEGPLRDAALAGIELNQYAARDVTAAQAHRLYERAAAEIKSALEPYGYYHAEVTGELKETGADYIAVLHVAAGEPVRIATLEIKLDGDADGQLPVQKAIAAFAPAKGQPLDHALYEKSKAGVQAALFGTGYLEAELVTRKVEVSRSANTADIHLEWKVGPRFRLGETVFEGGQFPDAFLDRYVPWNEGDFYTQDKVLELQQRLIDADYFAVAQVQPDIEHAHDAIVPIKVMLAPAKRTIYTGGLFIGTDTGFGVRGGVTRRWLNSRGHKGKVEAIIAERLKTINATYQIPLAGPNNHSLNFGFNYRDENTDTSQSNTWGLAATDSAIWNGWTRTYGMKFVTGDFEVANIPGSTTLLYPEASLSRKRADDPVFVRKGYSLTFAARAAALVGSTDFAQVTADGKWIRGIGEKSRFIARGSLGAMQVGDFDKLPPELRFFAGGDRSIRGYGYETIGPPLPDELVPEALARCAADKNRDCQTLVIGGKYLIVGSAEYEYYFRPNWGIATFIDTGDAFSTFNDYRQKIGVGIGARWRSPVGLIRVDFGFPVRDDQNSGVELHLVIGPDL